MMKTLLLAALVLAVGVAAAPTATAHCADGHAVDCVHEARDFVLRFECFNGPIDDRLDHFCWA